MRPVLLFPSSLIEFVTAQLTSHAGVTPSFVGPPHEVKFTHIQLLKYFMLRILPLHVTFFYARLG